MCHAYLLPIKHILTYPHIQLLFPCQVPGSAPGIMEAEEDMRLFNPELEKAGVCRHASVRGDWSVAVLT